MISLRVTAVVLLVCALPLGPALAQDPWAVRRSSFDPRVVARYKAILARKPNDRGALNKLARLYRKHRSLDALIKELKAAARKHPGSYARLLVLGHLERRAGRAEQAIRYYTRAAAARSKSPVPQAAVGAVLARQGRRKEAEAAYARALALAKSTSQNKRYLRALARLALVGRDMAAAGRYYQRLLALAPSNVKLRLELARALAGAGQHEKALGHYAKALKRTADSARRAQLLKELGTLQGKLGRVKQAVATFRKAMALTAPGHWLRRDITERMIDIYRKREELKSLITEFERRWKRRGPFQWEVLGRLYAETGDEAKAKAAYRAALKRTPYAVQTRLRLIALLDRSGLTDEVVAEYRKLARYAPGEPRYQIDLARRLHAAGKHAEAVAMLQRCERRFPRDPSVRSVLRDLYNSWGYYKRAKKAAVALVRIEPRDPTHVIALGEQYYTEGKHKKAIAVWKRLLRIIPRRHLAMARLAAVYAAHKLDRQAIALYRKAIKLSPKTINYRRSLARLLESKRMYGDALRQWDQVLQLAKAAGKGVTQKEARTRAIAVLRRSYSLRRRIRQLRSQFEGPNPDPDTGLFLAEGYHKMGQLRRTTEVYQRMVKIWPEHEEALLALERVYRQQRMLKRAVEVLKRMVALQLKRKRNPREYYLRISELLVQMGRDKDARAYANKAEDPNDPRSIENVGRLCERQGDYAGARKHYARAIKLSPHHFPAHFSLARLHSRAGRPAEAEKLYRAVLRKATNPNMVERAFARALPIASYRGTLVALEKELLPLAATSTQAKVYRRLLVRIYRRQLPLLIDQVRRGDARRRQQARQELRRIGQRGLSPLLEELTQARAAKIELVRFLGYLGNPNAVAPLLRIAEKKHDRVINIRGRRYRRGMRRWRRPFYPRSRLPWLKASWQVDLQVEATVALGRVAHPRAVAGLIRLLDGPEPAVRDAAAWALSRVAAATHGAAKGATAARTIRQALFNSLGDSDSTVQMMACVGLASLGQPNLRPVLEEVMQDQRRHARVRAACAWGLGLLGDARSVDPLVRLLSAGDGEAQRCAAWSLGMLADKRAVGALVRALWTKRNRVRDAILWSLARVTSGGQPVDQQRTLPDVLLKSTRMDAEDFLRRLTAAVETRRGAHARAMIAVIEVHGAAIGAGIKAALGRHRDVVLRVLRDLDSDPRSLTLGRLTAGRRLLSVKHRERLDRAVRGACAATAAPLGKLRAHRDPLVRKLALSVLSKLAPPRLAGQLRRGLADRAWTVRVQALDAVALAHRQGHLARRVALALALPRLQRRRHWRERESAVRALSVVGGAAVEPALVRACDDGNGFVREAAVLSLGRAAGPHSLAALRRALADSVPGVRLAAAEALVQRRAAGVRALLQSLANDPSPKVRARVKALLKSSQLSLN